METIFSGEVRNTLSFSEYSCQQGGVCWIESKKARLCVLRSVGMCHTVLQCVLNSSLTTIKLYGTDQRNK